MPTDRLPRERLVPSTFRAARSWREWKTRASCALWGHHVDNHVFEQATARSRHCRCGTEYLREDGSLTHVRHTLSCFLGHHVYKRLIDRDACHEYVCVQCGHPLLYPADADPYTSALQFRKKVRYLCGIFGHRVTLAANRDGCSEYACHCGHSFLKAGRATATIRHPLSCTLRGHWIRFVTSRAGFAEYVCETCGHPFCFADARAPHESGR
jgi:hypothetical protein